MATYEPDVSRFRFGDVLGFVGREVLAGTMMETEHVCLTALPPAINTPKVSPLLVVGLNRSGTKWLSNILCNHSAIAGIQSTRARGILETNLFHRMGQKFDLRSADDFIGFIELWSRAEDFRTTGESVDYLYGLSPRPQSFVEIFGMVAQRFAARRGARYWLQKCGPEQAADVIERLGVSQVVVIQRNSVAVAQSLHKMNIDRGHRSMLLRSIPGLARQEKLLRRIIRRYAPIMVEYDELRASPDTVVRHVCSRLELEFEPSMLDVSYEPNTSFHQHRPAPMQSISVLLLRLTATLTNALPLSVLDVLLGARHRVRPAVRLVPGTFGDLKDRLADSTDYYV